MEESFSLNPQELQLYQPNRYPFLMIDKVTEVCPGKYAKGYKNLTNNEWYFPKHFENHPNMPGALQLEAMAQMLTVAITTIEGLQGKITHALEHKVRFKKEVLPGDRLDINTQLISWRRGIGIGQGTCYVEGEEVSSAKMTITIPEILEQFIPR